MWAFQYKHGDRPLDGFTIQRAAGRGGFGEVYYAVSDSGREVALKAVTGYEQIELRGISQCMNLKNPHLVSIFDVKYNDQGRPFVIMEFVAGPSLRQLLDESPGGLGAQKAAFFLREIGKGLTFLHDCGIVHRDLKPGNIFYENGYVKIGDYGLSKAMEPTQHSGQTITVGTVHYMAPEIGGGRYDKSIDIYAMGAVLYEMLTGQPPFLGSSAGEILMKHVSSEPDLTHVEEPFKTVVRKAMAKNPADRYQSVQEMVEAVFGAEHIQQSVSCFRPDDLSVIAQRVAHRVAVGGGSATPPPIPRGRAAGAAVADCGPACGTPQRIGYMFDKVGDRIGAWGNRMADLGVHALPSRVRKAPRGPGAAPGDEPEETGDPLTDPLSRRQRRVLALIMLLVIAAATAAMSPVGRTSDGAHLSFWGVTLGVAGATLGLLLAGHRILPQMTGDSGFMQRLASGGTAAGLLMLFGLPVFAGGNGSDQESLALTAVGALLALLLTRPPDLSPSRPERVEFGPAIWTALVGFVAWIFTHGNFGLLVAILAGSQLLAQVLSPWDPFAAKRRLGLESDGSAAGAAPPGAPSPAGQYDWDWEKAAGTPAHGGDAPTVAWPPAKPADTQGAAPAVREMPARASYSLPPGYRRVPASAWFLWLATLVLTIPTGVALLFAAANMSSSRPDFTAMTSLGVGSLLLGVVSFLKLFQRRMRGWFGYAFRPLLLWACAQTVLVSAIMLANGHLDREGQAAAIFFIVLPAVLILVLLVVRSAPAALADEAGAAAPPAPPVPPTPSGAAAPAMDRRSRRDARRERRRQRRARWNDASAWRVKGPPFHVRVFQFVRNLVVGTSVTTMLVAGTLAFLFLALDVPGMLAAGIPDKDIPAQMTRDFGFSHWPQLLRGIAYVVGWGAMLLAAAVLIVSRRNTYGLHILRGSLGVGVFALSLMMLVRSLQGSWAEAAWLPDALAVPGGDLIRHGEPPIQPGDGPVRIDVENGEGRQLVQVRRGARDAEAERVARAVERYVESAHLQPQALPVAGAVALLGLVLMCWPARSAREVVASPAAPMRPAPENA